MRDMLRVLVFAGACGALIACSDSMANRAKEANAVPNERSDTKVGADALKALADLSKEDRAEVMDGVSRGAARRHSEAPSLGFVIIDEALPGNAVAAIIQDPSKAARRFVVFSNRNYNDAAFAMVAQVLGRADAAMIKGHAEVRVTSAGTVVDNNSNTLFALSAPAANLAERSETLQHLRAVAKTAEPIEIANLGKGTLYTLH